MNMATLGPVTDTNDGAAQFEMANTAYRIPRLKKKVVNFFFQMNKIMWHKLEI